MTAQNDEYKSFEIKAVQRPEITVVGMKITTNLARGVVDCSMLWVATFMPRMSEIKTSGYGESYGISMLNSIKNKTFDYWATMPVKKDAETPKGMEKYVLTAGTYLECQVDSLEDMPVARRYVSYEWLPDQRDYTPILTLPCYERYPADYQETGHFSIYYPVKKLSKGETPEKVPVLD